MPNAYAIRDDVVWPSRLSQPSRPPAVVYLDMNHYINLAKPLAYSLGFENTPTATAPASQVVVTDQLDPAKVNLSAVTLGAIQVNQ